MSSQVYNNVQITKLDTPKKECTKNNNRYLKRKKKSFAEVGVPKQVSRYLSPRPSHNHDDRLINSDDKTTLK